MAKLIDIINKLKSDYEDRQKQIDDILDNTNKMLIESTKAIESFELIIISMGESIDNLQTDYTATKNMIRYELDNLKKNPWLRLFGVK